MDETMAAPPNLHDIVLPEPVSWMPQTVGSGALLGVFLVALGWTLVSLLRRRRANRYRRTALARLEHIERALFDPVTRVGALAELPVLIKQTALACRPRSEVASLSGIRWLRYLDESCGGKDFSEGAGRVLPMLAYAAPSATESLEPDDMPALVEVVRRWIRGHRNERHRSGRHSARV